MSRYPIEIHGLVIAPEHRVFGASGRDVSGRDVSGADLISRTSVNVIAGSGIEGDRFCRHRPDYNGHVTFFSQEVWDEVRDILGLSEAMGPELTRRNVIVSGVDLKALYGVPFEIDGIRFLGTIHCAPCPAMNRVFGDGATRALRGRGGLRAQVKTDGTLSVGPADLVTNASFDPESASAQPIPPKLP
ncbi:molybdenum cofactor biosysynthesis protein [Opitutia bacterium ISCC 51]|nr:molybdenum cofactor biosysynthesis protein [Opitutae bacterium ISCC 51]QXD29631.1 molybdenum cofactor biosysynthesis protein [Opitutae bacterium ISCC 52]